MSTPAAGAATWFDGRTAAAHPVTVDVIAGALCVRGESGALLRTAPLASVRLAEAARHAPRFAYLDDGSTLEVHDTATFNAALGAGGERATLVARLQRSAVLSTIAVAALVLVLVFGYTHGVPALARWAAFALPPDIEARLGRQFERTLEDELLRPTQLSAARQAQLQQMLQEAAARGAPGLAYVLKNRGVRDGDGSNAFSVPGGTIYLLDGLVDIAASDDQILAVLAHELGHVANKHGMRNVLQALGIAALAHATWGDFAGAAANVPVVFGALRYSRAFEREADDYAVQLLHANGRDATPLIEFFEMIAGHRQEARDFSPANIFSTHPPTRERIERLKNR
jgi:predicted Zn-dependent protease